MVFYLYDKANIKTFENTKFILVEELIAYVLQEQICFASCLHFPCQQKNHLEFFPLNLPQIRNTCKIIKDVFVNLFV